MSPARVPNALLIGALTAALAACSATTGPTISAKEIGSLAPTESAAPSEGAEAGPPADAARLEDGDTIVMSQFSFSEVAVIVEAGATLTFTNNDNVFHTVTNGVQGFAVDDAAFDQPVDAGDSIEITFDEPGRYDVTCEPHPIMQMTVFVEG